MSSQDAFEAVNAAEDFKQLAEAIRNIAEDGQIRGRTRFFDAEKMAAACENFPTYMDMGRPNVLTREYGIRQQAMYLDYYSRINHLKG